GEGGGRLVVGNVDLSGATTNYVRWVETGGSSVASRSAVHLEGLFPGAPDRFPLAPAARLSASFPYVTPAAVLPTSPRRRVVEAGYYDDYGLALACDWLREYLAGERAWLARHVSAGPLIRIRDEASKLRTREHGAPEPAEARPWTRRDAADASR